MSYHLKICSDIFSSSCGVLLAACKKVPTSDQLHGRTFEAKKLKKWVSGFSNITDGKAKKRKIFAIYKA